MRFTPLLFLAPLLLAASATVQPPAEPLGSALQRARAEQRSAEAEALRLDRLATSARNDVAKLQAQRAAATSAIEAAEARITVADAQLRLVSTAAEARHARLRREQQPIASLLSGLVMMARRPPLLAIADRGGNADDLVKVRVLLDSTMPVIRGRTEALSAEVAAGDRLEKGAREARQDLLQSRQALVDRRQRFAALEARALKTSAAVGGEALAAGDVALSAGESVELLQGEQASNQAARSIASGLSASDPAPARPIPPEGPRFPSFAYMLPANARVTEGLGSVNASGVRSHGITLATYRGAAVVVPASGTIRFSGPFRSHDGVVIIDHGNGWMSLIVGVASRLKPGQRVRIGDPLGRALGQLQVELSQNGLRVSPALIAGSSGTLSNRSEGG